MVNQKKGKEFKELVDEYQELITADIVRESLQSLSINQMLIDTFYKGSSKIMEKMKCLVSENVINPCRILVETLS